MKSVKKILFLLPLAFLQLGWTELPKEALYCTFSEGVFTASQISSDGTEAQKDAIRAPNRELYYLKRLLKRYDRALPLYISIEDPALTDEDLKKLPVSYTKLSSDSVMTPGGRDQWMNSYFEEEEEMFPLYYNREASTLSGHYPVMIHQNASHILIDLIKDRTERPPLYSSLPLLVNFDPNTFEEEFSLGKVTTEKSHPVTANLSRDFEDDYEKGLSSLFTVDQSIFSFFDNFAKTHLDQLETVCKNAIKQGKRIIFVGSGSSGRVGIDLAAKWHNACDKQEELKIYKHAVTGCIAGGLRAFVKAKEGFEDSIEEGILAAERLYVEESDVVFLISGSGSAKFNIGFAEGAKSQHIYYFCNSQEPPKRTQDLFDTHQATPVIVDTGPQAVSGSTRLQAASIAELCLGSILMKIHASLLGNAFSPQDWANQLLQKHSSIEEAFPQIATLVSLEKEIFSAPDANFRKTTDITKKGYVTLLSDANCIREIMIDATETSPTFSTNPPRSIHEQGNKQAEFRAYLLHEKENMAAWKKMLSIRYLDEAFDEANEILVADEAHGFGSLENRSQGEGNLTIFVAKHTLHPKAFVHAKKIRENGGKVALISIGNPFFQKTLEILFKDLAEVHVPIECEKSPFGIDETLLLKHTLNMISNGSMVAMQKVYGNIMIDLRAANNKLIDRSVRIVRSMFEQLIPQKPVPSYRDTLVLIQRIEVMRKAIESQHMLYIPSPVKIALTMLGKEVTFSQAVAILKEYEENIHQMFL